jgi:sulfur-carrier protein adenylyltransferase/sulfurtransferase
VIWFIENLPRHRLEREALEALALESTWLQIGGWRLDDSARLVWDADIVVGDRVYPVTLQYPNHFPYSPPLVLPRGVSERWSSHQYWQGGELCLEFGPDNWQQDLTGADMICSAYRLLQGEQVEGGVRGVVASRHATTLGQDIRADWARLLITRELANVVASISERASLAGKTIGMLHTQDFVTVIATAVLPDGSAWVDGTVPKLLAREGFPEDAALVRWPGSADLPRVGSLAEFNADVAAHGIVLPPAKVVVLARGEAIHAYGLLPETDGIYVVAIIPAQPEAARLDEQHQALREHKVAIVGCGSVGSKIATMLARSGVGAFLLVDDDLMLSDNLMRNDLDWRDVGAHKVHGVARRVRLVNPAATCNTRKNKLGGQESSGSVETLISSLAQCDLIIDATADPRVFNYLCAASAIGTKPMLWAEVFGGGVGGLIARHRPGLEPEPALMRRVIENWFAEKGVPAGRPGEGYEERESGVPLIADDADVTVIAAHATRLAIDTLIAREPSAYPHAAYVIGLARGLCFDQAFETFPIDVGPPPPAATEPELDPLAAAEEVERVRELVKKRINAAGSANDGSEAPST